MTFDLSVFADVLFDFKEVRESVQKQYFKVEYVEATLIMIIE